MRHAFANQTRVGDARQIVEVDAMRAACAHGQCAFVQLVGLSGSHEVAAGWHAELAIASMAAELGNDRAALGVAHDQVFAGDGKLQSRARRRAEG
jgi:hypothetical protein